MDYGSAWMKEEVRELMDTIGTNEIHRSNRGK